MMLCAAARSSCDWRRILWDGVPQRLILWARHDARQSSQVSCGVRQQRICRVRVRSRLRQAVFVQYWAVQVRRGPSAQHHWRWLHIRPVLYSWESSGQTSSHYQFPANWTLQVRAWWQRGNERIMLYGMALYTGDNSGFCLINYTTVDCVCVKWRINFVEKTQLFWFCSFLLECV